MTPLILATAALQCLPQPEMVARLAMEYNEAQVAVMMDDRGMAVQVFASATGTWTIATLGEDGVACIVAAGDRFAMVAPGQYN